LLIVLLLLLLIKFFRLHLGHWFLLLWLLVIEQGNDLVLA
jgi:hypothetical protein